MLSSSIVNLDRLCAEMSLGILRWLYAISMAWLQFTRRFVGSSVATLGAMPGLTSLMRATSALYVHVCECECVCVCECMCVNIINQELIHICQNMIPGVDYIASC